MTSPVYCQVSVTRTTSAAFCALVFIRVQILVMTEVSPRSKTFLTLSAWIPLFSRVKRSVLGQVFLRCKPFVTHCTHMRPWLVITWMLSAVSFGSRLQRTPCICTTSPAAILRPLRWKDWERFCVFRGQQRKQTSGFSLNKAGVKRELLDTVKARKLAYYGHTMRKQGNFLDKEIMQGTMPGARRRGRPRTAWIDNIKSWKGLSVEESIRMTEDRDKWRKYVHGVANPRTADG